MGEILRLSSSGSLRMTNWGKSRDRKNGSKASAVQTKKGPVMRVCVRTEKKLRSAAKAALILRQLRHG